MSRYKVLVLDASERSALAIIRSLGSKGIEVVAADSNRYAVGFFSKYCKARFLYPSPYEDKYLFIKSLLRHLRKHTYDLLIPVSDFTTVPVAEYKDELSEYVRVAVPDFDILKLTYDKALTVRVAKECNVPIPKTFIPSDPDDIHDIGLRVKYPVVIKPRSKVIWINGKAVMLKITEKNFAYNYKDLLIKYRSFLDRFSFLYDLNYLPIIQEYVRGTGYGVSLLIYNSKLQAFFVHKRLHEYPITGGASTLRMSVFNSRLVHYATKLMKYMKWDGVAMVEFKYNENTREGFLIEVNGRWWGSLPLAISSGVDFPYLLFKVLVFNKISSHLNSYKIGVLQKWLIPGDILWFISSIISKGLDKSIISDFIFSLIKSHDDIISRRDLKPIIGAILLSIDEFYDVISGKRNIYGEII